MMVMMMIVLMTMGTECFTKCCNKVRPVPTLFVFRLFKGQTDTRPVNRSVSESIDWPDPGRFLICRALNIELICIKCEMNAFVFSSATPPPPNRWILSS